MGQPRQRHNGLQKKNGEVTLTSPTLGNQAAIDGLSPKSPELFTKLPFCPGVMKCQGQQARYQAMPLSRVPEPC